MDMLPFGSDQPRSVPVYNVEMVPKELDIFYKAEVSFLPEGKTFADLTPEEEKTLRSQYRFSPYKPGLYQTITGMAGMI